LLCTHYTQLYQIIQSLLFVFKEAIPIERLEFLDFFAGIGCFRFGFEKAGFICRGHCEIDKYANKSYFAMHDVKEGEWFEKDITKVSAKSVPVVSLWCAGTPCQNYASHSLIPHKNRTLIKKRVLPEKCGIIKLLQS
jgi:hypothetical protein